MSWLLVDPMAGYETGENAEDASMTPGLSIPLYQVDAFTDQAFRGNPAAVCLLEKPLSAEQMQKIAAEMNLSETAFVEPPDAEGVRHLRWFTPAVEVPLCGHATLATSHTLLREAGEEAPLRFQTLSGILTVEDEDGGWLRMDFPADPPAPADPPPNLLEALGCPPGATVARSIKLWLVRLNSESEVLALKPDMTALGRVELGDTPLGVSVTAPGHGAIDFVSRFFGPWVGVDEDPVTGMAHTVLGPYWMNELGSEELTARQISARGGELRVRRAGDRIHVSGQAVTVVRGKLNL
jgi:PhzF family phenazine biosynthesis protein